MMDFQRDYETRINPELMTRLLAKAVPVVDATEFRYTEVALGLCRSVLPLNAQSSNQHGTHQGLLMAMAGDYTGGLALASLITGEPILGVHEVAPDNGMSLWLTGSDMEYRMPSTEDVTLEARFPADTARALNLRYHAGGTILAKVEVYYRDPRGQLVAKGVFKYFCKKRTHLGATAAGKPMNAMMRHVLKTSAKMVARMRAEESERDDALFHDEVAAKVAGAQGKVIGDRFLVVLPELQRMVAARTRHLDDCIRDAGENVAQVVFIGSGFDFRMLRHREILNKVLVYELDLPEMLQERQILERELELDIPHDRVRRVACDLLNQSLAEQLASAGLDVGKPTFFIYEGCSMYFTREQNTSILQEVQDLMQANGDSRLWMDAMHEDAMEVGCGEGRVSEFLRGMAALGEPFVFGLADDDSLFSSAGLNRMRSATTADVTGEADNGVYGLYRFLLLRAQPQLTQSGLNGSPRAADARAPFRSGRSAHRLPVPIH
jgi:methyltransferase (TIGR00027 family)